MLGEVFITCKCSFCPKILVCPTRNPASLSADRQGGGRAIEDIREIKVDEGLRELLCIEKIPSSDAFYSWLRRMGKGNGLKALEQFNRFYLHNQLKREKEIKDYTLDIDATAISGQKKEAEMTYKGFKGYMPIVGHLAENELVIYAEFRPCPTAGGRAMSLLQPETWSL